MTALTQRATRDRFDAAPWAPESHPTGAPAADSDHPRRGDIVYDVTARKVYRYHRGYYKSRVFPPLERGNQRGANEDDEALVYAETLAAHYKTRSFIIGLPPTSMRAPIISEQERLKRQRENDKKRRTRLRIVEYGDNQDTENADECSSETP